MDEGGTQQWTEQRHTVARIEAELAADPDCPPQLASAAKREWFDKHAAAARAEIERLRKCVAELEPAQATCKRIQDYLDDHDGAGSLCTDLGDNVLNVIDGLLETARAAAKTIQTLRDRVLELEQCVRDLNPYPMAVPDCGAPGPCACSEAHAGDDAVCAQAESGSAGPRPITGLQEICRAHADALVVHNGTCPACDALRKCMQGNTPVDIVEVVDAGTFRVVIAVGGDHFIWLSDADENVIARESMRLRDALLVAGISAVVHGRIRSLDEAMKLLLRDGRLQRKQAPESGQGAVAT